MEREKQRVEKAKAAKEKSKLPLKKIGKYPYVIISLKELHLISS